VQLAKLKCHFCLSVVWQTIGEDKEEIKSKEGEGRFGEINHS
jgi:hypothetical protein